MGEELLRTSRRKIEDLAKVSVQSFQTCIFDDYNFAVREAVCRLLLVISAMMHHAKNYLACREKLLTLLPMD
jgi:hypothetical protein